jgi:hypothetical protein
MRKSVIAVLPVTLLLIASGQAVAQTTYAIGMGLNSCGQYLSAVHSHPPGTYTSIERPQEGEFFDEASRYQQWLGGFISGSNWKQRNNVRTDGAAIDVWMRRWCEQNPTKKVFEAAAAFVLEQGK